MNFNSFLFALQPSRTLHIVVDNAAPPPAPMSFTAERLPALRPYNCKDARTKSQRCDCRRGQSIAPKKPPSSSPVPHRRLVEERGAHQPRLATSRWESEPATNVSPVLRIPHRRTSLDGKARLPFPDLTLEDIDEQDQQNMT